MGVIIVDFGSWSKQILSQSPHRNHNASVASGAGAPGLFRAKSRNLPANYWRACPGGSPLDWARGKVFARPFGRECRPTPGSTRQPSLDALTATLIRRLGHGFPAPSLVTGGHNHDASLSGQPSQPQPRGIPSRIRGLGYDSTYPFAPNPEQGWLIAIAVSTTSRSTRLTQISVHCPGIGTG